MAKRPNTFSLKDRILKELYFQEQQSCAEISTSLKKSIPVVTNALNELIEEGYVVAGGYAPSTGGRRPLSYSLQADKGYIVSVAMDQLFTRIVIVDLSNRQLSEPETIELDLHKNREALKDLAKAIQAHIVRSGRNKDKIIGVGIGMPGFINIEDGNNYTFFEQAQKSSHRDYLKNELDLPVFIDNDSRLTALAEWKFGLAKDQQNAMIINISWGTGLGMIVNGELFRGDDGYAGEFSHIPLSDNGILCECGKRGCLETETSLLIMAEKAVNEIKNGQKNHLPLREVKYMSDEVMKGANKGDQFCIELLWHVGYMLGKGISILIHIMNPKLIVLSGRGAKAEKFLMTPVQQALIQYCIPRLAENTELAISKLGSDAGIFGAAALVIEKANIYQEERSPVKENS